ncbi:MAG: DUF1559 domain-containing protein [Planctomycetaceae bacterium]|nr:DUF1559 domain-containing protein [Planctomycetaceae bacterium]
MNHFSPQQILSLCLIFISVIGCSTNDDSKNTPINVVEESSRQTTPEAVNAKPPEFTMNGAAPVSNTDSTTQTGNPQTPEINKETNSSNLFEQIDLKCVSEDYHSAVIVHPARIYQWNVLAALDEAGLADAMMSRIWPVLEDRLFQAQFDFDYRGVNQIMVLWDQKAAESLPKQMFYEEEETVIITEPPEENDATEAEQDNEDEAFPSVIIEFNNEELINDLLKNWLLEDTPTIEMFGVQVKRFQEDGMDDIYYIDGNRLIATRTTLFEKMMRPQQPESELRKELLNTNKNEDFIVVSSPSLCQALAEKAKEQLPEDFFSDFNNFATLLKDLKAVKLAGGFHNSNLLALSVSANDRSAAQKIQTNWDSALKVEQDRLRKQGSGFDSTRMIEDQAARKILKGMEDQMIDGLAVSADQNRVTLSLTKPKNFSDLVRILDPAIQSAKQAVTQAEYRNQFKRIGLAFHNYHDIHYEFPAVGGDSKGKGRELSWRVHILPYLGHQELYDKFRMDEPWTSAHNRKLIAEMPDVFKSVGVDDPSKTSMHVFQGDFAVDPLKGINFRKIRDGGSQTLLVVESAPDKAAIWTQPTSLDLDFENPISSLGNYEKEAFVSVFVNGRVAELPTNIDGNLLKALITFNGGENVKDQLLELLSK